MVELQKIDQNIKYRKTIENGYEKIKKLLEPGASTNVVKLVEEMLK